MCSKTLEDGLPEAFPGEIRIHLEHHAHDFVGVYFHRCNLSQITIHYAETAYGVIELGQEL